MAVGDLCDRLRRLVQGEGLERWDAEPTCVDRLGDLRQAIRRGPVGARKANASLLDVRCSGTGRSARAHSDPALANEAGVLRECIGVAVEVDQRVHAIWIPSPDLLRGIPGVVV